MGKIDPYLSLFHDIVLPLKLHGDTLKRREVHGAVHAAESDRRSLHGRHHLLIGPVCL